MFDNNLLEGMSAEKVQSLIAPQQSYGTYQRDIEMPETHRDVPEDSEPLWDPNAEQSKEKDPERVQEGRRSEKARAKPHEERKKRDYHVHKQESRKRHRRGDHKTRDSPPTKTWSRSDPRTQMRKKGIPCNEIFLSTRSF